MSSLTYHQVCLFITLVILTTARSLSAEISPQEMLRRHHMAIIEAQADRIELDNLYPSYDESISTAQRLQTIKKMARSSWNAYFRYAWGNDSLNSVTNSSHDGVFGPDSGRTIIAGLSTLHVMNLSAEFEKGRKWVKENLKLSRVIYPEMKATHFQVVTEYVGGLLSVYALTGDELFKTKATELAQILEEVARSCEQNTTTCTNPLASKYKINPTLSELGGYYAEYAYLSSVSDNNIFAQAASKLGQKLRLSVGKVTSLDASTQQYFYDQVQVFIQRNGSNPCLVKSYRGALNSANLAGMFDSSSGLKIVRKVLTTRPRKTFNITNDYSMCRLGAMLARGAKLLITLSTVNSSDVTKRDLIELEREGEWQSRLAAALTETCYQVSTRMRTRLGPQWFDLTNGLRSDGGYRLSAELAESYFILWRLTGELKYRKQAWEMVQGLASHCRTASGGFSGLRSVNASDLELDGHQPPIFLSATLKYLYLIFAEMDVLPLDSWIFNAVGHPLPVCGQVASFGDWWCEPRRERCSRVHWSIR